MGEKMSGNEFRTVLNDSQAKLIEKKSKFIAYIRPVKAEAEAITFINEIRSRHFDASHNVYAYVIKDNNIQRYSDDGEPSGTAGIPVLDAIKSENLTNIAVVVTRYFGGTLLGTGGLVRAYGAAARLGITQAKPITMVFCEMYTVKCEYGMLGRLQYDINAAGYIIEGTAFTEDAKICVCVRYGLGNQFEELIANSSLGRAVVEKAGEKYVSIKT